MSETYDRGRFLRDGIEMIKYLKNGRRTWDDISKNFEVHWKTARRRVRSLEEAGVPVQVQTSADLGEKQRATNLIWIDRKWTI